MDALSQAYTLLGLSLAMIFLAGLVAGYGLTQHDDAEE